MDSQPKDDRKPSDTVDQRSPESSSRRIFKMSEGFKPTEHKTSAGTIVFRTTDDMVYCRLPNDVIRRSTPKIRGKSARRAEREARRARRTT